MQIPNISKHLFDNCESNSTIYIWKDKFIKTNELVAQIYHCAGYFSKKYKPRQTVILCMDDCPEWIVAFHAMILIGVTPVIMDYRFSDEVIAVIKEKTNAVDVIKDQSSIQYFNCDIDIFCFEPGDDVAYYTTSGTTGLPKVVVYSHHAFCKLVNSMHYLQAQNGVILCPAKMSFVVGLIVNVLSPWAIKSQNIIYDLPPSSLRTLYQLVNKHKVTHLFTNPTILKIFIQNKLASLGNHLKKVFVSAEPLSKYIAVEFENKFGLRPINVYGATETLCSVLVNHDRHDVTDLGTPVNDCQFKIIDELGQEILDATPGRLLIQSPCVASRYHGDKNLTELTFKDGWYYSGDIVSRTDDVFKFVDRVDSYVKIRGCYTSSQEIEKLLTSLPNIDDATVIFDKQYDGRLLSIAYVVSSDKNINDTGIRTTLLKTTKHSHLLPDQIHLVDALPRTLNNKKIKNIKTLETYVIT